MMKIAYLLTRSDTISGPQIHLRDLSEYLTRQGHEVTILVGGAGIFLSCMRRRKISCLEVPHLVAPISPLKDLRAFVEIRRLLRQIRPDVLSTHSSKAGALGRLAARSLKIPVLFTAHGWAFTDGIPRLPARIYRWSERLLSPLADKIITVSQFDRQLALAGGVGDPDQIVVVHNCVTDIDPGLRATPEEEPCRLIMVARFEAQKDQVLLLKCLARLERDRDWKLDLVGDGPLRPRVQEVARDLGLLNRVRFLGFHDDVEGLLARSSVKVLITHWEGFPRSVLEAMRAGLPVVASNVSGVSEAVRDGWNGYLVNRGDEEALVDRIRQLTEDPALRSQMGTRSRELYEDRFRFQSMAPKMLSIYRDLVKAGSGLRSSSVGPQGRQRIGP